MTSDKLKKLLFTLRDLSSVLLVLKTNSSNKFVNMQFVYKHWHDMTDLSSIYKTEFDSNKKRYVILPYLVCRARSEDELAVRVKWQTVDFCCVGIYCMAGFGGVVRSSVPTEVKNNNPWMLQDHITFRRTVYNQIVLISKLFTSWASGHLLQIQREIREASARKHLLPQQCDQWRSSLHPQPSPPSAQHLCPTDRLSGLD